MKIINRPVPIVIVSILFILTGILGIATHTNDFNKPDVRLVELLWTLLVRILAVVCGILLLYKIKWARWLAIAWLVYHIVIGAFNSTSEVIAHTVILVIVCVLLFLPISVDYFKQNKSSKIN